MEQKEQQRHPLLSAIPRRDPRRPTSERRCWISLGRPHDSIVTMDGQPTQVRACFNLHNTPFEEPQTTTTRQAMVSEDAGAARR